MATAAAPDPHGDGAGVFITAEAYAALVEDVGHFAAGAFVTVALDAVPDRRGVLVVATSTRALARRLHVAKDTATGVLAVLVRRGYLRRRVQPRRAGRFAPARYTVRPPAGFAVTPAEGTLPCPDTPPTAPAPEPDRQTTSPAEQQPTRRPRRRQVRPGEADQLGLFGAASGSTETGSHR